jgi:shikimate kinase
MTTQVLISEQEALSQALNKSLQATATNGSGSISRPKSLPYQTNHQVELLHLQAETEALLQHLKMLKQRNSATTA